MIRQLQNLLSIQFNKEDLIHRAFNHTSYVNENKRKGFYSNERLEFLGDAVLELIVSEYLFSQYPDLLEGQLTTMRAQLVQEPSLAYLSRQLGLDKELRLGKGEELSGGRSKDSLIADVYEALLGAIFLDQGMEIAKLFVEKTMLYQHKTMLKTVNIDYKTRLQELVQQKGSVDIRYHLIEKQGPDHSAIFIMGLMINGQLIAKGQGTSKKQAEMQAAQKALTFIDADGNIMKESI